MLNLYILPRWETCRMLDIESPAVEAWLGNLSSRRNTSKALADPTRQRIRNVFSVLFTHGTASWP